MSFEGGVKAQYVHENPVSEYDTAALAYDLGKLSPEPTVVSRDVVGERMPEAQAALAQSQADVAVADTFVAAVTTPNPEMQTVVRESDGAPERLSLSQAQEEVRRQMEMVAEQVAEAQVVTESRFSLMGLAEKLGPKGKMILGALSFVTLLAASPDVEARDHRGANEAFRRHVSRDVARMVGGVAGAVIDATGRAVIQSIDPTVRYDYDRRAQRDAARAARDVDRAQERFARDIERMSSRYYQDMGRLEQWENRSGGSMSQASLLQAKLRLTEKYWSDLMAKTAEVQSKGRPGESQAFLAAAGGGLAQRLQLDAAQTVSGLKQLGVDVQTVVPIEKEHQAAQPQYRAPVAVPRPAERSWSGAEQGVKPAYDDATRRAWGI